MNQLTVVERGSLRKYEATIERGIGTFLEVGLALKAIREEKLYREQFQTFEKYVVDRWGMHKSQAYRLIDAAEVKQDLSPIGDKIPKAKEINKESQLRVLNDVPTEDLETVVSRAAEIAGDEPITAKILEQSKREHQAETQEPEAAVAVLDEPAPVVDYVMDRAKQRLEDHLRGVILQFGHLGLGGQADNEVKALRRKAGI